MNNMKQKRFYKPQIHLCQILLGLLLEIECKMRCKFFRVKHKEYNL